MRRAFTTLILLALVARAEAAEPLRKTWLDGVSPVDGKPVKILGWMQGGYVNFWPADNPHLLAARPEPAPDPGPARPKAIATPTATATARPSPADGVEANPSGQPMPTGVIAARMPLTRAGGEWYGGNVVAKIGSATGRGDPPHRVHLTVIGTDAQREAVRRALDRNDGFRQLQSDMGEHLAVQDYAPGDPMVADVGLPDGGSPDVVIQDAKGKEIYRSHRDPGPEVLAAEIRKADPGYKPGKEPAPPPVPWAVADIPELGWIAIGAAGLGLLYLARRSKGANVT